MDGKSHQKQSNCNYVRDKVLNKAGMMRWQKTNDMPWSLLLCDIMSLQATEP